jgi:CHAT domain-containing protein
MRWSFGLGLAVACCGMSVSAAAQSSRPSLQDSFRLGSGRGVLCSAQSSSLDPVLKNMFDRGYAIVCRDAATPVGRLYALRRGSDDPLERLMAARQGKIACQAAGAATVEGLSGVTVSECKLSDADVGYRVYAWQNARTSYVAEGLAGYDSALTIGLRTLIADRAVPGEIAVATTEAGDPAAFARVQAGSLSLDQALAEGYRRNNSGDYAEAAEFFVTLMQRADGSGGSSGSIEYLVNRALQQSNLGNFAEADGLFARAAALPTSDPVQLRLRRNFRVMHLLNQRRLREAQDEVERKMEPIASAGPASLASSEIDAATAARINAEDRLADRFGGSSGLTPTERAQVLDAQAVQLRGTILRLRGDLAGADAALLQALDGLVAIRGGRVTSTARLRAQTMGELSLVAEARKDFSRGEQMLRDALALLESEYPASAAVRVAQARLAGYLARHGQADAALALYREVVQAATVDGASPAIRTMLSPYFNLLAEQIPSRPELVADFFLASETLVRPGVANTQAVLARELSGGTDDAARLFRQSVTLTREIERSRVELARLRTIEQPKPEELARIANLQKSIEALALDQTATQAKLGDFPKYRALSTQALTLADLQKSLRPEEAYLKLATVGNDVFAIYVGPDSATAYRAAVSVSGLEAMVNGLRETIYTVENGQVLTFPFDVKLARRLFVDLLEPIAPRLATLKHLVFEPDGAMLKLPINLLVTDQAGVDAYAARVAKSSSAEFDFTGVAWLGRNIGVSTAVSARAFRDVRAVAPSRAKNQYLGLGQNTPATFSPLAGLPQDQEARDCAWPLGVWAQPISARELVMAQKIVADSGSEVVTETAFTDTALLERRDLSQYRILHFATHGLVEAPRPECPAQPALLTSFGGENSDGLLSFREIYDMRIDADLVILSACDTAGSASVAATREAGVTSGGGFALDGLVRAFVGAGGRSVVASHWPVPDDFGATQKLISGLFDAPPGTETATALRIAQDALMDNPDTSHPYYWAAFAIIGDGTRPVLTKH